MNGARSTPGKNDMHAEFWSEVLNERGHLGDIGIDGKIILR
jgi:hypothetical protein